MNASDGSYRLRGSDEYGQREWDYGLPGYFIYAWPPSFGAGASFNLTNYVPAASPAVAIVIPSPTPTTSVSPTRSPSATPIAGCTPYTCDFMLVDPETSVPLRESGGGYLLWNATSQAPAVSFRMYPYRCWYDAPGTALLVRTQTGQYYRSVADRTTYFSYSWTVYEADLSTACVGSVDEATISTWTLMNASDGSYSLHGNDEYGQRDWNYDASDNFIYAYPLSVGAGASFNVTYVPAASPAVAIVIPSPTSSQTRSSAGTPTVSLTSTTTSRPTCGPAGERVRESARTWNFCVKTSIFS